MKTAAQLLASCRHEQRTIAALPDSVAPVDLVDAYRIQSELLDEIGLPVIGWKAGCTSTEGQRALGIDEPIVGRLVGSSLIDSGALVSVSDFLHPPQVEVETGFVLTQDIDRPPSDPLELADAVRLAPVIELVDTRYTDFSAVPGPQLVADNAAVGMVVAGQPIDAPPALVRALDTADVVLQVDRRVVAFGLGVRALGHPLAVLAWVAQQAAALDQPLRGGDLVITGTCTGLVSVGAGHRVRGTVAGATVDLALID